MKTLLVTAFLAVAIGACSSSTSPSPVTGGQGTVAQNGQCTQTSDCEPNAGLYCAYPVNDAGTACPTTGTCVALGPFNVETVCPCGGKVYVEAYVTPSYSTVPLGGTGCTGGSTGDAGGGGTPPSTGSDASTGGATTGG